MNTKLFSEELMLEVKALQDSIREYCPEIESTLILENVLENGRDETSALIEHRISILHASGFKEKVTSKS
ncbi:hypothetical protein ACFLR1_02410 [Bacteroidota bacterium]